MSSQFKIQEINYFVFEIRYKPIPSFIDNRGKWLQGIQPILNMDKWAISDTRIDLRDNDDRRKAFCGFKNCSLIIHQLSRTEEFVDQSTNFLTYFYNQPEFSSNLVIERIGVRSRFAKRYKGSFDQLLQAYQEKISTITPTFRKTIGAQVIDIGNPITIGTDIGTVDLMTGPMKGDQLKDFFKMDEPFPIAIYSDFDYWTIPNKEMPISDLLNTIKKYSEENWKRNSDIVAMFNR